MNAFLNKNKAILLFSFIILLLSITSKNHNVNSDGFGTLLTSQSVIEHGTIKLDAYDTSDFAYQVVSKNEHLYYYFPLGSSISSIPFVFIATKILTFDMTNRIHEEIMQKMITAIVVISIFIILYLIANMYLKSSHALLLAFVFTLGSSITSTLLGALWNQSFATLYSIIALYLTLNIIKGNKDNTWFLLAIVLFMAYLTRPTMSFLSITIVSFLFFNGKKILSLKVSILVFLLLGLFVAFSLYEYSQILPDYYSPKRLESTTFWTALYGNLFSPSRGLFIFIPFLFLFFFNIDKLYKIFKQDKSLLVFLFWIIAHIIVISNLTHWWAGHSYGNRLMIDVYVPIFFLMTLLISHSINDKNTLRYKLNKSLLFLTTILAIYINTYQGLFNTYVKTWSGQPNIDENPKYLFDWNYPQFLYNKDKHILRVKDFDKNKKKLIKFNSSEINFIKGWSSLEKDLVWSIGKESELSLKLNNKAYNGEISLNITSLGNQEIQIFINDTFISKIEAPSAYSYTLSFNPDLLYKNELNYVKFIYSNPHSPNNNDKRILAMALKSILIE